MMYTAADLRRDYPSMNPKAGVCPPVEAVWRMNTMTEEEFHQEMAEAREIRRRARNEALGRALDAKSEALTRSMREAGVPERYTGVPSVDRNADLLAGKGLWIHGDVGTGKTVLAASVAKAWLATRRTCLMVSSVALFTELRSAMESGGEYQVIAKYSGTGLLVIDDLGQEIPSEWALSRLFEIIDTRYGARRPTIITTNYGPQDLTDRLERSGGNADAIVSRLVESTARERIQGADRRLP